MAKKSKVVFGEQTAAPAAEATATEKKPARKAKAKTKTKRAYKRRAKKTNVDDFSRGYALGMKHSAELRAAA